MSQATAESVNMELLELSEKLLKMANLQADTALKEAGLALTRAQTRFLPWQIVSASMTAGAALMGAAVALARWH